jgi:hypothetical protein
MGELNKDWRRLTNLCGALKDWLDIGPKNKAGEDALASFD